MEKIKIYLVEDDDVIVKSLSKFLESWSYEVASVRDFEKVDEQFLAFDPELVLMDVSLPFFNGYYWTEKIRQHSDVPIIFISSAGENLNKIMAMNMGADDYIEKPFDMEFLAAKITAILRRAYQYKPEPKKLAYEGVSIDAEKLTLSYQDQDLPLTRNEFLILEMLIAKPERVFKREEIMDRIWQTDEFIDDNTLTVNIMRLRKKLASINLEDFIKTKKKVGYYIG